MKKLAVYLSIVCSLLIVSLTLFSKTVQAETSKKVDVITEIKIQNSKGEELATGLGSSSMLVLTKINSQMMVKFLLRFLLTVM